MAPLAMGTLFPELDLADRPPSRGQRITSLSLSDRDDFSRREPKLSNFSFIPKKIFQISSRTRFFKKEEEEEVSAVGTPRQGLGDVA